MSTKKVFAKVTEEQLFCESKVSYSFKVKPAERIKIGCSNDSYSAFYGSWDKGNIELFETFKAMYLNRANEVLCIQTMSTGGVAACLVDTKLIFLTAVLCVASSIIVCHNHPSNNLKPSASDIDLTKRLAKGAELLDMKLLDSLIVTNSGYLSFADECILSF